MVSVDVERRGRPLARQKLMYPSAQVPRARGGNESNDSGDHNMRKIPDKSDLQFAEQEYYTFSALY